MFSLFSELFFSSVCGNVEFYRQKTALPGPHMCSVYLNLYDFKGKKVREHILGKTLFFRVIFGNRHRSHTGALFLWGSEANK